jgi:tRNA (cytidine/uridine-2'-O-)-methyltransferase
MDIVLVSPQIPQNTGSIARTCAATQTPLHLVEPLGFEICEKKVRRAGLDYWPHVDLTQHADWDTFLAHRKPQTLWYLTTHATRSYTEVPFGPDDCLVFGSETAGLGATFLEACPAEHRITIPMMSDAVRSLNLSNAVSIVLYHALLVGQATPR